MLKNKPFLIEKARAIFRDVRFRYVSEFDDHGNVGKRYRRQDEIGTPFCVTVDFQTLEDDTVTIRNRDTMLQERISASALKTYLAANLQQG